MKRFRCCQGLDTGREPLKTLRAMRDFLSIDELGRDGR